MKPAMTITDFDSWKEISSLNHIQAFASKVQESISIGNAGDRQRCLLELVRELQIPIKIGDVLDNLAQMFWSAMSSFVEYHLIETALKSSQDDEFFLNAHPEAFFCVPFFGSQQIRMGTHCDIHIGNFLPNGEFEPLIPSICGHQEDENLLSSAILSPGRYEFLSENGQQSRTIILERASRLESLKIQTGCSVRPVEDAFILLNKTDFQIPVIRRKRKSSLYTSGNSLHIDAFQVLSSRVPVVSWTTAIVNSALIHACRKKSGGKIFFLDIGMSFGRNCIEFLKTLAADQCVFEVEIYGIDPDSASLEIAAAEIDKFTKLYSFIQVKLTTIPHFLEHIRQEQLESIFESAQLCEVRLVHSAFTMHHLSKENRQLALQNIIKCCKPHAFVLSEPNVNHLEVNYERRVTNALGMFSLLHELIHKDQQLSKEERFAVWNTFFGKELVDIVGRNEDARSEKHEPISQWIQRGLLAGLKLSQHALAAELFPAETFDHPVCTVQFSPGLTEIQVHGTSIVGVMVFVAED
jgi:SAM-dependent methyltransferase